jgi:hypothetical protein
LDRFGLVLWGLTPLSTIFQLYRGRGNRRTRRKPTCRKSLTNFITPRSDLGLIFNVQFNYLKVKEQNFFFFSFALKLVRWTVTLQLCSQCLTNKYYMWFLSFFKIHVNATFNNISVISWQRKPEDPKKTDLPEVTDKLYHTSLW